LSLDTKKRLNALKNLMIDYAGLRREFMAELTALEKKYHVKYQPIFDKRADIVSGKVEPTEAQTQVPDNTVDYTDADAMDGEAVIEGPVVGIPNFWRQALLQSQAAQLIEKEDLEALSSLKDIKVRYLDGNPGFALDFVFGTNDYFSNEVLSKTYFLSPSDDPTNDQFVLDKIEGTVIEWKEGKNLAVKTETRKQRHKDTNKTRIVKREVPSDTFFNLFKSRSMPAHDDDDDEEDVDDEHLDELEGAMEMEYTLGEEIKDMIIPAALEFFTGEAASLDEDLDDDEFGGFGSDDDEDEDEE
ncbi:nucleosome assembly protein, partial [Blastocladiella britannica]